MVCETSQYYLHHQCFVLVLVFHAGLVQMVGQPYELDFQLFPFDLLPFYLMLLDLFLKTTFRHHFLGVYGSFVQGLQHQASQASQGQSSKAEFTCSTYGRLESYGRLIRKFP